MTSRSPENPPKGDAARSRQAKLGTALRENLKRRKAQARGRAGAAQDAPEAHSRELPPESLQESPEESSHVGLSPHSGSPIGQSPKQER